MKFEVCLGVLEKLWTEGQTDDGQGVIKIYIAHPNDGQGVIKIYIAHPNLWLR